ncbi:MAG: sulfurtransferase, partial [Burkholderiaceae bacterium]
GLYAARFWWLAQWIGHAAVAVLDGGLPTWQARGLPMNEDTPRPIAGDLRVGDALVSHVDTQDVEANLSTQAKLVVDARAPERYRGEVEPLDPVAGHIPHAVNRPMAKNLAADGCFKSAPELRGEFETLLAGRDPGRLITSCGSGVTACHHLLAMQVAGLRGASLYAGSWSAWCADPRRPVERGN